MIICVCNKISSKDPITSINYKCGTCKQITTIMGNILKKYKNITLHHEEHQNIQTYKVFEGYIERAKFSSTDPSAYRQALEFFNQLKNEI